MEEVHKRLGIIKKKMMHYDKIGLAAEALMYYYIS